MNPMTPPQATPDWLSQLAPDHAPPPAGWWPPAPGWWLVAAFVIALIALAIWWWRHPRRRLRQTALRELRRLRNIEDDTALAQALADLTRRYAVVRYGRASVAGLTGEAWIGFVSTHGGQAWAGDAGAQLLACAYGGHGTPQREAWLAGARGFLGAR